MQSNKIHERIGKVRIGLGKTQQEVADALGVKRETVHQWESGSRQIKADAVIKLSQFFGVSADYLLGLSDVKSVDPELQAVCKYTGLSEAAVTALRKDEADIDIVNFMLENAFVGGLDEIATYLRYTLVGRKYIVDNHGNVEPVPNMDLALEQIEGMCKESEPPYYAETVDITAIMLNCHEKRMLEALARLRGIYQERTKERCNG